MGETGRGEEEDMVTIPAGAFPMGTSEDEAERLARAHGWHPSWLAGEVPQRRIVLPAYALDRYPVTNRQFAEFCRATGHAPPPHWGGAQPPEHLLDHPVTHVNWAEADAYSRWAGKRLPTEAEWEKAARGEGGLLFPWGNRFEPHRCCWNPERRGSLAPATVSVAALPEGASPYGVRHMAGNVAEWCADGPGPGAAYIKGGCWHTAEVLNLRSAARIMSGFANNAMPFYGFRCAKEVA
jgi:formylglycine-generating enzyme required for sulfatase activity